MITMERVEELATIAHKFNYDYQYIDHYNTWLSWHNVMMEQMYIYRTLSVEEKRMVLARVAELHNIAVAPYLGRGVSKVWDESIEKQKNVRLFINLVEG
jgi:hypothetical protein